jgi:hypothetical protein
MNIGVDHEDSASIYDENVLEILGLMLMDAHEGDHCLTRVLALMSKGNVK